MRGSSLVEEDAELVGGVAEWSEIAALHLEDGETRGVAAEVERGDDAAGGGVDGNGERTEADFVLLITDSVTVAADVAEGEAEFFYRGDGAGGVGD